MAPEYLTQERPSKAAIIPAQTPPASCTGTVMQTPASIETPQDGPARKPPWWKKGWAKVGVAVGFIAVVYYLVWAIGGVGTAVATTLKWFAPLFENSNLGWRAFTFGSGMAAFGGGIASVLLFLVGRRVGYQAGCAAGKSVGLVEGRKQGYEEGEKVGAEKGRTEGFEKGRTAGLAEGVATGKQEGHEEGFAKGQAQIRSSQEFLHVEPFIAPTSVLCAKLREVATDTDPQAIVNAYAELFSAWTNPLISATAHAQQSTASRLVLTAATLKHYLQRVVGQRHPATDARLLPATYEIYAWCVAQVLQSLVKIVPPQEGATITVWTHFSRDLCRWYNISVAGETLTNLHTHSQPWWEGYKETMEGMKKAKTRDMNHHSVQLRRLVASDTAAVSCLKLFIPDGTKVLTISDATSFFGQTQNQCPQITQEVLNAFQLPGLYHELPIHIIGQCACVTGHKNWLNLKAHFERTYHDAVVAKGFRLAEDDKGVYCGYVPVAALASCPYSDVFLVDMQDLGQGTFGMGYYSSPAGELDSIVMLGDAQVMQLIERVFRPAWLQAGAA